jgi:2-C-methyl-D-erythritol 4-phosphate cytidylyltransferase
MFFWAIMPAAGRGQRMGAAERSKQYLPLAGRHVIEWAIAPLLERSECHRVVVALDANDSYFQTLSIATHPRVKSVPGGRERVDSVRAGLHAIVDEAKDSDWVLVHDAARPCVSAAEIDSLLMTLRDDPVGGLLARPVVDTLKQSAGERVQATVPRSGLWRALTPQMFRYGLLCEALRRTEGESVTDEAQSIELLGLQPRLILGSEDNLKITYPEDLVRAERVLRSGSRL